VASAERLAWRQRRNQDAADERIPLLLQTPAALRFLSCEPMLEKITVFDLNGPIDVYAGMKSPLHWVICGGESGPNARPMHPDWARSLHDQCAAADVPFFFKQHGEYLHETQTTGTMLPYPTGHLHQWPDGTASVRVGKRAAGGLLDGHEHHEFPAEAAP